MSGLPSITINPGAGGGEVSTVLQIIFLLTVLTLAPAILILTTSFTRIAVVLGFVRNALATQQMPPNQVLIGLTLFLTFFVMAPVFGAINQQALQPYMAGELDAATALGRAETHIKSFMLKHTREKELALFASMNSDQPPASPQDVSTLALIPAFAISELKTAFQIGFVIFVPFLVIDMVVASTLMSMGMLMLPPMMISLPFKIVLFVLVDGWYLVIRSLVTGLQ
jgi:flagellar biosynthetic protein FliP